MTSRACRRRSSRAGKCLPPRAAPACWSFTRGRGTGPIFPMHRRTRSSAAIRQIASVRAARWAGGEPGHNIIPELYPLADEPVIDKPGKGAFYQTDLELMLRNRDIDTLFVCGVTTEVCVNTTVREANDRGFCCIVLSDCCGSYFPEFHAAGLAMIKAQGGIFGSVAASKPLLNSMASIG
jgi:nicotinamidase-related amidase